jgi:hypothetical protein
VDKNQAGGLGRDRISPDAAAAVWEALRTAKRPLASVAADRLSSVDADNSLWRQLADASVADHTAGRGSIWLGRLSVDEIASGSLVAEWAKLAIPPAPGTHWSTLTPADPVDFLRTELSFESVDHYRAEDVLMRNSGSDCITAQSSWTWAGRQLLFDFTVTVRPMTADPAELAKCLLCWDTGNAGPDFSSRSLSSAGGQQREHVSVTTAGTTARVWHEGSFDLRFVRCDITVL